MERMNIEHKIYLIESKITKDDADTEFDKFVILMDKLIKDKDVIVDSMSQLRGVGDATIHMAYKKRSIVLKETDNNWKSMFGLLRIYATITYPDNTYKTKDMGMQSAVSAALIVYQWLNERDME